MTVAEQEVKTVHLHAAQAKLVTAKQRFVAGIAGTGGGKTWTGPYWLATKIAQHPGAKWLAVGPTYDLLSLQTRPTLLEAYRGTDFEGEMHLAANEYHLPDGGVIYFRSADRPERLESIHAHGAWLDEAGQMSYAVWVAIQARLGLYQGDCLLTTTFYPKHRWLRREWYDRWRKGDPDYLVVQWRSIDNPAYPQAEYERARATLDPRTFAARYEGLMPELAGQVYPDFDMTLIDRAAMPEGWEKWDKYGGIDFGYHNPFVILNGVLSPDDVLYVYEEHYRAETLLKFHAKRLRPMTRYFADPSAKQDLEELKAEVKANPREMAGVRIEGAANDIAAGIERVASRVRTGRLKVCKNCVNLIDEADGYAYADKEDRLGTEQPVKADDHAMDAVRYMVMGIDGAGKLPAPGFEVWSM